MYLIDADEFFKNLTAYAPPEMTWNAGDIAHKLDEMPRINTEPVRHGVWLPVELEKSFGTIHGAKCSLCGYESVRKEFNYCPNCGAKMDKGAKV